MAESKHYYDFTNELYADEIYEGLLDHGLFTVGAECLHGQL